MRHARTLIAQHGATRAAAILGASPSTIRRWAAGEFQAVRRSTRKLANRARKARKDAADYARHHKAKPVTRVPVVPKAARLKRLDYSKLGQPIPGKPGKRYTKKNLPVIDSATVAHDVRGFGREDVLLVLQALRDRGGKFRLVFVTPRGVLTDSSGRVVGHDENDRRTTAQRRASTAPLDPEGMSDDDLEDWLTQALQSGSYKPMFIMEME